MSSRTIAVVAAAIGCVGLGVSASAQVLEIGPHGQVARYDGPTVFTKEGVSSITLIARLRRRQGSTARKSGAQRENIATAANAVELSPALIEAVARQESGLRSGVVSRGGAVGEMQLMPSTARALGVDPWISAENYRGGAGYLRLLMRRYDGDLVRTLSAYNAGPGAVDRYGGAPPYRETQAYVAAVLERLGRQAAEEGEAK